MTNDQATCLLDIVANALARLGRCDDLLAAITDLRTQLLPPTTAPVATTTLRSYDDRGRLRGEWDARADSSIRISYADDGR